MSDFKDLSKDQHIKNYLQDQQQKRRDLLLEEQRMKREEQYSYLRDLKEILTDLKIEYPERKFNRNFKDNLMLSEWMMEAPEDIEDFLLVPCPKGVRVTVVKESSRYHRQVNTNIFYKTGVKHSTIKSNLPKDTILDCVYSKKNKIIYILDAIMYAGRDLTNCDTEFRRYWIQSKIDEDELRVFDGCKLELIKAHDFVDTQSVYECFQTAPIFNDGTELDGYLFYHKESSYTIGETPLVLWLFPFMVDEVLTMFHVHPSYNSLKPLDYTNYLDYIKTFNEKLSKKRQKSKNKKTAELMECEVSKPSEVDLDESVDEMQRMIDLEKYGDFE